MTTPAEPPDPEQYRRTDGELGDLFDQYIRPDLEGPRHESPIFVSVIGPLGNGKTTLASKVPELFNIHDASLIDADDYYPIQPDFRSLRERYGDAVARKTLSANTNRLFEMAVEYVIEKGRNMIITAPMTAPDWTAERLAEFRAGGAHNVVVAMAVHEARSLGSMISRYQDMVDKTGYGRWHDASLHDTQYRGLLETVDRIERDGLADEIYAARRGGVLLSSNQLISRDPVAYATEPITRQVIELERARAWTPEEFTDFASGMGSLADRLPDDRLPTLADALNRGIAAQERFAMQLEEAIGERDGAAAQQPPEPAARELLDQATTYRSNVDHLKTIADTVQERISPVDPEAAEAFDLLGEQQARAPGRRDAARSSTASSGSSTPPLNRPHDRSPSSGPER